MAEMTLTEIKHRSIETNGIIMHIAEAGKGPLVVLLHGFPELWYSWRHQLAGLAEAGFHAVAPDQRGYGRTDRPEGSDAYTQLHLVGDVVGLIDALGADNAVVVGHDWGAVVGWNVALLRPDLVRAVAGLSVPYVPRGPMSFLAMMRAMLGDGFYMSYFQQPGVAEAELERDVSATLRKLLSSGNGDPATGQLAPVWVVPEGSGLLDVIPQPDGLPSWLTEEDLGYYGSELERTGFGGPLNWYRTLDSSWELMGAWNNAPLLQPALYMVGERDSFMSYPGSNDMMGSLSAFAPKLDVVTMPGSGHYLQQERPAHVNERLIQFVEGLPPA